MSLWKKSDIEQDEYSCGLFPQHGLAQPVGHLFDHVRFQAVTWGAEALEAWVHAVHVAVVAAFRDAGAAGDRVPGPVSPFDLCHGPSSVFMVHVGLAHLFRCGHLFAQWHRFARSSGRFPKK